MIKLVIIFAIIAISFAVPQQADPKYASILRLDSEIYPDGRYRYGYETENGISAEEHGQQRPVGDYLGTIAQGNYRFTSPEGQRIGLDYTADENGFHPVGSNLPTPPPTPEPILRSLAYIEARQGAANTLSPYNRY